MLKMATATASAGGRDRLEPIKRLGMVQIQPPRNPNKPLTSFFISDILNNTKSHDTPSPRKQRLHPYFIPGHHIGGLGLQHAAVSPACSSSPGSYRPHPQPLNLSPASIVRPWADSPPPRSESVSSGNQDPDDEEISVDDDPKPPPKGNSVSPLDALLQMTSKTFDGIDPQNPGGDDASRRDQLSLFSKSTPTKKRRKSRTAFTNQQIYELEKRFLYQKYLTPADRDEIAAQLGLSNAQVITWFQNRRAKLKRDLEELKADVTAAKSIDGETTPPLFDSEDEYQQYKKRKSLCDITSPMSVGSVASPEHSSENRVKNLSLTPEKNDRVKKMSLSVSINAAATAARDNPRDLNHDMSMDSRNSPSPPLSVTSPDSRPTSPHSEASLAVS